jgi:hypothetical protein
MVCYNYKILVNLIKKMEKKINQKQIEIILKLLFTLNCGIQDIEAIKKLFELLPPVEIKKEEPKKK